MKSRVNLPVNDDEEFEEQPARNDYISQYSNQKLTTKDLEDITLILHRHMPVDKDDVFGKIDYSSFCQTKASKGIWPKVVTSVATVAESGTFLYYKRMCDTMFDNYVKYLIDHDEMLSTEHLKTVPIIELHRVFPLKSDYESDLVKVPHVNFDDEEKIVLYQNKNDLFKTRFDKFFIRVNRKRYIYIAIQKDDSDPNKLYFTYDKYNGDEHKWILQSHVLFEMKFTKTNGPEMPCDIKVLENCLYEEILTKHIDDMGWDNKAKQFWTDVFGVPQKWSDLAVGLLDDRDEDGNEMTQFLYSAKEQKTMRKVYGNKISIITDPDLVQQKIRQIVTVGVIPDIMRFLSALYIIFGIQYDQPDSVEEDKYGRLRQKFGKAVVISKELYFPDRGDVK